MMNSSARDFDIDSLGFVTPRQLYVLAAAVDPHQCTEPGCGAPKCATAKTPCDQYCAEHCRAHRKHGHECQRSRTAAKMRIYMRTYQPPNPAATEQRQVA